MGFKNPPKHTRFKKGVSGNPTGRPRKKPGQFTRSSDIAAMFWKVFAQQVNANVGGKPRKMDGLEAILTQLMALAIAGNLPAIRVVISLLQLFAGAQQSSNEQLRGMFDALMAGPVETPGDRKP